MYGFTYISTPQQAQMTQYLHNTYVLTACNMEKILPKKYWNVYGSFRNHTTECIKYEVHHPLFGLLSFQTT